MHGQLNYIPQWFHYYGGLADKIEGSTSAAGQEGLLRLHAARAGRRGRRHHALELAAAAAGLEDRARAGRRLHGRGQAVGVHLGLHAGVRRAVRRGRLSARRVQRRHRLRRTRSAPPLVEHPLVRKISFTGSDATGRLHQRDGRPRLQARQPWNWAASRPTSCSTTRIWSRRSTAPSPASSPRPARPASPARGCWCRTASTTRSSTGCSRLARTARMGDPMDADTQVGPVTTPAAVPEGAGVHRHRPQRGRDSSCWAARPATRPECGDGWFVRADDLHRRAATTCASRRRRCSARCSSVIRFKRRGRGASRIANDVRFGLARRRVDAATSAAPSGCPNSCRPAPSGSTPTAR